MEVWGYQSLALAGQVAHEVYLSERNCRYAEISREKKMGLSKVGYFFEQSNEALMDIFEVINNKNIHDINKIINYLESGYDIAYVLSVERDLFSSKQMPEVIGSIKIKTDGVWVWPTSLAYYIRKYNISIDNLFIENMIKNNWRIPKDIDVNNLSYPAGYEIL